MVGSAAEPAWVEALCLVPSHKGLTMIPALDEIRSAEPGLDDPRFVELVRDWLSRHPEAIDAWQHYSWNRRVSPAPYLDGLEVGFYDDEARDVRTYEDRLDACAHFIHRETHWLLRDRSGAGGAA